MSETAGETNLIHLVDVVSRLLNVDTSIARRKIAMGEISVNEQPVTDPGAKLVNEPGIASFIGHKGSLYPFYP